MSARARDGLGSTVSLSSVHNESSTAEVNRLGRHQLVLPLGQGGMGTIHLALAGGLGEFRKLLVVKELRRDLVADQRFIDMFFNEVKLAARLSHPNVVQTIEAGQEGERYYLAMEFLDGQPLSALLAASNQPPEVSLTVRLRILADALAGLHYAHQLKEFDGSCLSIVHRDVSPQNIFVTYDGQVKVVDFGIAAVSDTMTSPGIFKGKLSYAAPEQLRGDMVDARTDVFAMGVVLWETITLRRFARNAIDASAIRARLLGHEPRIGQLDIHVDPDLAAICDRALQVEPDDRFPSAEAFREALESYMSGVGQRVDSSDVRAMMLEKFAAHREDLHRRINEHLRGASAAPPPQEQDISGDFDRQTLVADMSRYMQDTQRTVVSTIDPAMLEGRRHWDRRWVLGAGASLLALAIASVFFISSGDEVPTPSSAVDDSGLSASHEPNAVAAPNAKEAVTHSTSAGASALGTERVSEALGKSTGVDVAPQGAGLRKQPVPPRPRRRRADPNGGESEVTSTPALGRAPKARVDSDETAVPGEKDELAPEGGSGVNSAPTGKTTAKVSLGEDLNAVRGGQVVRAIDTEL